MFGDLYASHTQHCQQDFELRSSQCPSHFSLPLVSYPFLFSPLYIMDIFNMYELEKLA